MYSDLANILAGVMIAYAVYILFYWFYANFMRSDDLKRYKSRDTWAIVTGGSDGIGLAFARRLARRGFNVLVTGRNEEKLMNVVDALRGTSSTLSTCLMCLADFKQCKFEYLVSDATVPTEENMQSLVLWAELRDVGVLVNNVGMHQGGSKPFPQIDTGKITESVHVNCLYPTLLTSLILKRVLLKRQHPCLIINVASVVGCSSGVPSMAVYAATKAFNHSFSVSLSADLFDTNVDVLCVNPGLTASKMTKMSAGLLCSSAEECAEGSLNKAGLVDIIPHWKHIPMWIAMAAGDWVPAVPRAWIMSVFIGTVQLPGE